MRCAHSLSGIASDERQTQFALVRRWFDDSRLRMSSHSCSSADAVARMRAHLREAAVTAVGAEPLPQLSLLASAGKVERPWPRSLSHSRPIRDVRDSAARQRQRRRQTTCSRCCRRCVRIDIVGKRGELQRSAGELKVEAVGVALIGGVHDTT